MINEKLKEYTVLAVVLLAVFGVYLHTTFPAFKGDDSPETAAAAYTLGIQHAPGYPLYTLLGKIAVTAYLANPAFKVNLLSAFLAVLTLLVTYFILTRHIFKLFGMEHGWFTWALGLANMGLLAFSNIFWNQAIEAKGGIYMLNLLFLSLIIYLSLDLSRVQSPEASERALEPLTDNRQPTTVNKHLYLISYVYGLSLANHWPSMAILSPLFAFILYKFREKHDGLKFLRVLAVFACGLSAYLFLYIRAAANPPLNWGDPSSPGRFIDVVLRKIYAGESMPLTVFVLGYHAKYLLEVMASNYWALWVLAIPGAYAFYKKQQAIFWLLASAALVTAVFLIFYFRFHLETIWLMGIFLMPVQYILFLFIAAGLAYVAGSLKTNQQKLAAACVVPALAAVLFTVNFTRNDRHEDYISYDLIHNIAASAGNGAYYIADHDLTLMPMFYGKIVLKHDAGLKFFPLPFLLYDWGVKQAQQEFGAFPSKTGDVLYNLAGIVGIAIQDKGEIYRDYDSPAFNALKLPLFQGFTGLIKRVSTGPPSESPGIYDLYSYRGIYDAFARSDENTEIVTRYLIYMSMHAERLMQLLRYREAIVLYEKALRIPAEKLAHNIYFSMAWCYQGLKERDNALTCLQKAIEAKKDFLPAYEAAGRVYYGKNDIWNAGKFFTQAVMLGSADEQVKELAESTKITITQNEAAIMDAEKYASEKQYAKALKIYSALVKLEYRTADVFLRMGQLYYGLGDRDKALLMLINSNKNEMNPGAYFYQAKIYWEKGMADKAKTTALEGLTRFKDDKRLQKMYFKMKGM